MNRGLFGILLAGLVVVAGIALLYFGILRFNYPSSDKYPVRGIDISHHQGFIDWEALQTEDIRFVIIKATEGGDYQDPEFNHNWMESRNWGYATGAYHFYRLCTSPEKQAANFINMVPKHSDAVAPVVDLEYGGNCESDKTKAEILADISLFMNRLEQYYEKKPIIYATQEFYADYLINQFPDNPIWIRDIFFEPELPDDREWLIWQYANRAHLEGIDMYVDLNVLRGDDISVLMR